MTTAAVTERLHGRDSLVTGYDAHYLVALSLRQLTAWCAERFAPVPVTAVDEERPYNLPWVVLDAARAEAAWGWRPRTPLLSVLEEIARHADDHPDWLTRSGA